MANKPRTPPAAPPAHAKLKMGELRQLKELCGRSVLKEIAAGEMDEDIIAALALILLRRSRPEATQADADELDVGEVLGFVETAFGEGGADPRPAASGKRT